MNNEIKLAVETWKNILRERWIYLTSGDFPKISKDLGPVSEEILDRFGKALGKLLEEAVKDVVWPYCNTHSEFHPDPMLMQAAIEAGLSKHQADLLFPIDAQICIAPNSVTVRIGADAEAKEIFPQAVITGA
ncbi:MAG: BTG family protein [Oscillatoriaceae bacterium SKW80]|nr:BTG family protein [Oscillatoriaceae bacterium SKYG93]MCX8119716.1 BTG family protein [Oscillatoriaceae bacterium SKW80]MDW8452407.1 hypothetical protein [Oscillatoriaceae cyanobacterium SKYGB_i_bin93]HIK27620.1 hypothetical protein [Oscillatoriaceae cyanobacterium M7585_C2015_266]